MYSTRDVPWDMGICEYAWLMEILVGDLKGNLQFPSNVGCRNLDIFLFETTK